MQLEVQALLKALLAEQQRERELYQSMLAAMSVTATARRRMVEDIVVASKTALASDNDTYRGPSGIAESHLTEAIKKMAEARNNMFTPGSMN
ncbi:MAG TPA: hypothetical protein PLD46_06910 [Hyphomicrobium sp.]|nr:hypothetical protein [Hyphomicrobium sp.]